MTQVVNRDRSKFYFTLLTKIDPEPEGFTTRRHTGLGRRERLIPGSYIQATSTVLGTLGLLGIVIIGNFGQVFFLLGITDEKCH